MPRIKLFRATHENWFVSLGGSEPSRLTHDNGVQALIDNETTLKKIIDAVNSAAHSVYLMQSEYHPYFVAVYDSVTDVPRPKESLTDVLSRKAAESDIQVYILLNNNLVAPDSFKAISDAFSDTSVRVRGFPAHGPHAMHAKALVVDEAEAYIIGPPFRQDFWDSRDHIIDDPRRGSKGVPPKHDVSTCLRGSAVACVTEYFVQLWNYLSDAHFDGSDKIAPAMPHVPAGAQTIQIVRSVTPKTLTKKGETGILEAYRRAIHNAKDFIYLENQYLTNKSVANTLRNALKDRPELQLILLLNENPNVPSYRQRQNDRLKRLGIDLRHPLIDHPRIGVFTLWSKGLEADKIRLQRCYIHSKVGIVDDTWATIGSANLDGPSLNAAEEFKLFVNPKKYRSMELNAVLLDVDAAVYGEVKRFRRSLWNEYLEVSDSILSGPRPAGGWLGLWKKIAADNVTSLKGPEPTMNGRILPYSAKANVTKQLETFGIPFDELDVVAEPLLPPLGQKA